MVTVGFITSSQARMRSCQRLASDMVDRSRVFSRSWRAALPSPVLRAACLAKAVMRSAEARSRVAEAVMMLGMS